MKISPILLKIQVLLCPFIYAIPKYAHPNENTKIPIMIQIGLTFFLISP